MVFQGHHIHFNQLPTTGKPSALPVFRFWGKGTSPHPLSKARKLRIILGTSLSLLSHHPYLIHHHSLTVIYLHSSHLLPTPAQQPQHLHPPCPTPSPHPHSAACSPRSSQRDLPKTDHIATFSCLNPSMAPAGCQDKNPNMGQTSEAALAGRLPDPYPAPPPPAPNCTPEPAILPPSQAKPGQQG